MQIVIGNIVALVGSVLMAYSGIIKEKQKIIIVQTIQMLMLGLSNIILGGIPGAIINSVNCIRNILCYEEKLGFKEKLILVTISVSLSIYFNNLGIIGILLCAKTKLKKVVGVEVQNEIADKVLQKCHYNGNKVKYKRNEGGGLMFTNGLSVKEFEAKYGL